MRTERFWTNRHENLTPNQNIEIFSVVYSFIRCTQRFN